MICRTIHKTLVGAGLLAFGAYLWMGTSVGSYAKTAFTGAKSYVKGQVPVDYQIQTARQMLTDLTPDVQKTLKSIAEEEVKIDRLRREIASTEKNLDGERAAILALREHLGKGLASYKIAGATYSALAVENELNRRFTSFKRVDDSLKARRETLVARESTLMAAREKYDNLLEAKARIENEIAGLEARNKMIEARQTASKFQIDDSQLSKLKQLVEEINERLDVSEKVAEQEGNLSKRIPLEQANPEELGKQIDSYFGDKAPAKKGTPL